MERINDIENTSFEQKENNMRQYLTYFIQISVHEREDSHIQVILDIPKLLMLDKC